MATWPRDNQDDLIKFYGNPAGEVAPQLVKVVPPFRMTYDGKPLSHLMFHRLAAPALNRALKRVWDYYGRDQKKVDALGISKTAGTYNPRMIRGSTTKWSNHAYGAAIDINAEENGFNVEGNIPIPMIAAFKAEGARWGGDYRGRKDPMHFEFCQSGEPVRTFEQWIEFYGAKPTSQPATPATPSKPIAASMRQRMLKIIMGYEGRIPPQLHVTDGGPEISGITQKDHPQAYGRLKMLLDQERTAELTAAVISYYDTYTDPAQNWTDRAGVEFFLRDCILHRGPSGTAEILQMALGVEVDHQTGPTTRGVLAAIDPNVAIDILRAAREHYENKHFNGGEGKQWRIARGQWQGLVNRWNKAQAQAKAFQKEQGAFPVGTTVGVGTGGGAAVVAYTFWDWITSHIVPSIIIFGGLVAVTVFIIRKIKGD